MKCRIVDNELLKTLNEKIDKLDKNYKELNEAYKTYNKWFEKFIEELNRRNDLLHRDTEIRKAQEEAQREVYKKLEEKKEEFKKEDEDKIELECWNCHNKMIKKENQYRCEKLVPKKNEQGEWKDTGCATKIYDNYKGHKLSKKEIESLIEGNTAILHNVSIKGEKYKKIKIKLQKNKKDKNEFYPYIDVDNKVKEKD